MTDVFRQPVGQLRPCFAAVGRFVEAAARAVRRRIHVPRRAARLPERGVYGVGVRGIHREIDGAGVVVLEEHFAPGRAAVGRLEHAAFGVRPVLMAERRDVDDVRIVRIDDDFPDLPRIVETDVRPRFAAVDRTCTCRRRRRCRNACRLRRCRRRWSSRIARRNRDRADRRDRPHCRRSDSRCARRSCGFPDAAVNRTEVEVARARPERRSRPARGRRETVRSAATKANSTRKYQRAQDPKIVLPAHHIIYVASNGATLSRRMKPLERGMCGSSAAYRECVCFDCSIMFSLTVPPKRAGAYDGNHASLLCARCSAALAQTRSQPETGSSIV